MANSQPWDYYPLFPIYAFTDIRKARNKVKKITGRRYEPSGKQGSFTEYEHDGGSLRFGIIYLDCDDETASHKYAVLAHECVHYAQAFEETVTKARLDDETFAYVMQCAMLSCIDQIGGEWFNETQQTSKSSEG